MKILIACERSGRVRNAFRRRGYDAISCDLAPSETPGPHIQGDIREVMFAENWAAMIAFPDCTYLCASGLVWNPVRPGRDEKTKAAFEFALSLILSHIPQVAMENPIGYIGQKWRKPDQIIQPYYFGEDAAKSTCLWLKNLPRLHPTKYVRPRIVNGYKRWSNQLDSGSCKEPPDPSRSITRAHTYHGVAEAMAEQWGPAIGNFGVLKCS